ncbi:MAG: hypothetical protein HRT72_12420, partial [Flavobacteriales bacterium]|nr:hypothetical protein [Flavobacteriales bacterium]
KNYKGAVANWHIAISTCPTAGKSLYINGAKMYKSFIKEEADEVRKGVLVDTLIWISDERIKYFGQEGYVKGRQAGDVLKYKKDISKAFELAARSYELEQNKMEAGAVNTYFKTGYKKFKKKELEKEVVMDLYLKLSDVVAANLGNEKKAANYKKVQDGMDKMFSNLASCEDLLAVFQPRFDAAPEDVALLKSITKLLDKVKCIDSELFYNSSVKLDALESSETSKYNLGKMSMTKKKYTAALDYFKAATELATEDEKKGKYLFKSAEAYKALGQSASARTFAKKAITARPSWGIPYILIGDLYTGSAKSCAATDAVDLGSLYWAAYDQYKKAKAVDSEVSEMATSKMAQASKHYPEQKDTFFKGLEEGAAFTVGCWINEATTVRVR